MTRGGALPKLAAQEVCECGNYMPIAHVGADGKERCRACHDKAFGRVNATGRLNLRRGEAA